MPVSVRNFPLIVGLAGLAGLVAPAASADPADSHEVATFETIHATVERAFFDPDLLGVDWSAIGARYRERLSEVGSDSEFLELMTAMLREIPASHLDLLTGSAASGAAASVRGPSGDRSPLLEWSPSTDRPGTWIVRVRSFGGLDPDRVEALAADLRGSEGVILDVRGNEGGDVSFLDLAGRFFSGPTVVGGLVSRGWFEATGHRLEEPVPLDSFPTMGAPYELERLFELLGSSGAVALEAGSAEPYEGCVTLLIDGKTGSSAEAFTMAMDRFADAPLIGDPTAGALLSSQEFPLPNGWRLRVPVAVGVDDGGRIFWDDPIEPDIAVDPSSAAAIEAALDAVEACTDS